MPNKPKKLVAAFLSLFAPPIGMMYVVQIRWAGIYLLVALGIGAVGVLYLRDAVAANAIQLLFALTCATHAYRLAAKYPDEKPRPAYSRWYGLVSTAVVLFSIVFGVRAFFVEYFRYPSSAMLPTIPLQANLIVQKWGYGNYGTYGLNLAHTSISSPLGHGDIVVFEFPQDRSILYAQRLIGLPGDKIAYRGKRLFVNGKQVPTRQADNYFNSETIAFVPKFTESMMGVEYSVLVNGDHPNNVSTQLSFPFHDKCVYDSEGVTCEVPAGHYFAMGDNRDNSYDSRMWGFIPADHIVGKVLYVLP